MPIEQDYYNPATGGSTGSIEEIEYLKQLGIERANQAAINALLGNTQVVAPGQESGMPSNIFQGPLSGMGLGLSGMGLNALINLGQGLVSSGQNRVGLGDTGGNVFPWTGFDPSLTGSAAAGMDVSITQPPETYFTYQGGDFGAGETRNISPFSAVQTGSAIPSGQEGMAPQVFFDSTSAAARAADAAQAARMDAIRQAAIEAATQQTQTAPTAATTTPSQTELAAASTLQPVVLPPFTETGSMVNQNLINAIPPITQQTMGQNLQSFATPTIGSTAIPSFAAPAPAAPATPAPAPAAPAPSPIVQVPAVTVSARPLPQETTIPQTGTNVGVPGASNPFVLPPVTVPAGTTPQPVAPTVAIPTVTATSVITPTVPSVPLNIPASTATTTQTVATTTTSLPTVTDTGAGTGGITYNPNAGTVAAGTGRNFAAELAASRAALQGEQANLMNMYGGIYQNLLGQTAIPEAAQRSLEQARLDQAKLQRVQQGQLAAEDIRQAQQAAREAYGARGQVMGQPAIGAEILNREAIRQQREDQARAGYQASMGNVFNAANLQTGNIFQPIGSLVGQTFNPLGAYPQDVYSSNFNAQLARDIAAANNAAAIEAAKYGAQASRQAATTSGIFDLVGRILPRL